MTSDDDNGEYSNSQKTDSRERERDQAITTSDGFQEALRTLVLEADANGVDVRGGWPIELTDGDRGWDVEITSVSRQPTARIENAEYPASAVLNAVAERKGVDTADLPPLYDTIGPDILEILHEADTDSDQQVTFDYVGYRITVRSDGSIVIDE